jgi:phage baseplate assembly protein W
MERAARVYSDLDLNFSKHPVTKDVSLKTNEYAIAGAIRNIVMTNFGERRFSSRFGSDVFSQLFEPLDDMTAMNIKEEIITSLTNYEPRAKIDFVNVVPNIEENGFNVTIRFYLLNSIKPITTALFLQRLR